MSNPFMLFGLAIVENRVRTLASISLRLSRKGMGKVVLRVRDGERREWGSR